MREKMKKMLFLMLFLIILGAANVSAQVRIGGNGQPNPAAVLDLNADNTVTGTKGLALPRVSLTDINTALTGSPTVNGMMVYNTNASVTGGSGAGIYYWVTNKWVKMLGSDFVEGDGIVGNEITDATPNSGLIRSGSGNTAAPYTLGIAPAGIDSTMLAPLQRGNVLFYENNAWHSRHLSLAWIADFIMTENSSRKQQISTWYDPERCMNSTASVYREYKGFLQYQITRDTLYVKCVGPGPCASRLLAMCLW
ncbi:hypothetical protein FACS189451_02570 [Bacteroidia bacterium]|nr:hypothetical protein FACS189451_02570 [Bacteroidia bacterium]